MININKAMAAIEVASIENVTLREMLILINVSGDCKAPMELKVHIKAVKMIRRRLNVLALRNHIPAKDRKIKRCPMMPNSSVLF